VVRAHDRVEHPDAARRSRRTRLERPPHSRGPARAHADGVRSRHVPGAARVFASAAIAAQTSGGSYLISAAIQHGPLAAAAGRGSGREIDLVDSIPRPGLGSWNCAGQLCWSHKDGRSTGAGVGRGVPGRQYAGGCQAVPGRSGMTWVRKAASCSTSSPSGQRKIR
jgi:hypothetical protein